MEEGYRREKWSIMKRKRLVTESKPEKPVEVRAALLDEMDAEDELAESHYARPH